MFFAERPQNKSLFLNKPPGKNIVRGNMDHNPTHIWVGTKKDFDRSLFKFQENLTFIENCLVKIVMMEWIIFAECICLSDPGIECSLKNSI